VRYFGSLLIALNCLVFVLAQARDDNLRGPAFMAQAQKGFEQIYSLDYDDAFRTFSNLKSQYPRHPAPPVYLATVIWLRELFERNELNLDHFIAPGYFTQPSPQKMAPADRKLFMDYLKECETLCRAILDKDPDNIDARYFLGSMYGIRGAFAITIDRSYREAFSKGKKAYEHHLKITEEDPSFNDAYMSVGLYEYIVDNLPWYIKWIAVMVGYRGSEERGFEYLNRAAEKGIYAADDARVLQMVLYVREKRFDEALNNVRILRDKYPRNFVLHINQAYILEKMAKKDLAAAEYRQVLHFAESQKPNYQKIPLPSFRLTAARKLLSLADYDSALVQFQTGMNQPGLPEGQKALAHLGAGQALDALGRRQEAIRQYQAVLEFPEIDDSHSKARRLISRPYNGAK